MGYSTVHYHEQINRIVYISNDLKLFCKNREINNNDAKVCKDSHNRRDTQPQTKKKHVKFDDRNGQSWFSAYVSTIV